MAKKREFKKTRKQLDKEAKKELVKASGTRDPPFRNRQRTLLFSSRGIPYRFRHLMRDLASIMPHGKTDVKLDTRNTLSVINEICEMKSCNNCVFFEVRGKRDLYMWVSKAPLGPSIKFFVTNVHTTDELKMTGNCLKGSRYVLSFDDAFDKEPHLELIREVLTQSFGVPKGHPKSKPFVDHIMSFHYIDGRIWVRHFQIATPEAAAAAAAASGSNASAAAAAAGAAGSQALVEIGPRFVLQVVKVFSGSFQGGTLYKNGEFETPSAMRRLAKRAKGDRYASRVEANENRVARKKENVLPAGEIDDVFDAQKDSSEDDDDDDDDDVAEEDGSDGSGSGDESEDGMDDEDDDDDDASDGSGDEESSS